MSKSSQNVVARKGRPVEGLKRQVVRKGRRILQSSGLKALDVWYEAQSSGGTFTLGTANPMKVAVSRKDIRTN